MCTDTETSPGSFTEAESEQKQHNSQRGEPGQCIPSSTETSRVQKQQLQPLELAGCFCFRARQKKHCQSRATAARHPRAPSPPCYPKLTVEIRAVGGEDIVQNDVERCHHQLPIVIAVHHHQGHLEESSCWLKRQQLQLIFLKELIPSTAIHSLFVLLQALTKNRIKDTTHQFRKLFHLFFRINKSKAIGSLKERPAVSWRL